MRNIDYNKLENDKIVKWVTAREIKIKAYQFNRILLTLWQHNKIEALYFIRCAHDCNLDTAKFILNAALGKMYFE